MSEKIKHSEIIISLLFSREDSLQRSQQCKLSVQCMERSLEKWRNEVDTHQKLSIERADQVTKVTLQTKILVDPQA